MLAANNPWLNASGGLDSIHDIYKNGDLWTSRDSGVTWTAANLPERYFYTEFSGLSSSGDGLTFIALARCRNGTFIDNSDNNETSRFEFQETSPGKLVLYISEDGGSSWFPRDIAQLQKYGFGWQLSTDTLRPLRISTDGTRMFLVLDEFNDDSSNTGGMNVPERLGSFLFGSDDKGLNWKVLYTPGETGYISDFATGGGNATTFVVLASDGINLSTDGGDTFTLVEFGDDSDGDWNSVEVSSNGNYIAIAAEQTFFYAISNDGGETWEQLPVDPSYWTIAGVSDEAGITSFDEDFFLWTQSAPSSGRSVLEAVPSALRASARASAAAAMESPPVQPAFLGTIFNLLVKFICNAVDDCNKASRQMSANVRAQLGVTCSKEPAVNFITNFVVGLFIPSLGIANPVSFISLSSLPVPPLSASSIDHKRGFQKNSTYLFLPLLPCCNTSI